MYKEPKNKMIKNSADLQAKQIMSGVSSDCKKSRKYVEMSAISLLTGVFLFEALWILFKTGVESWLSGPDAPFATMMVNAMVYVLPLVFLSFSAATFFMAIANDALAWLSGGIELLLLKIKSRRASRHNK